jgi:deoxyribose-phosphate aldolase
MDFNAKLDEYIRPEAEASPSLKDLKELVSFIDLTLLNLDDTEESIKQLCQKASSQLGPVASVCIYPQFLPIVTAHLDRGKIKIASVANFPTGNEKLNDVIANIQQAILSGANEIDMVFPYMLYQAGNAQAALEYVSECKKVCSDNVLLKVILEVSEFANLEAIYALSSKIIVNGANFIKTSTGKSKSGATLESASAMLLAIKSHPQKHIGFKASGGIREVKQALSYVNLAKKIMEANWVTSSYFRIGASVLLDNILSIYKLNKCHGSPIT